MALIKTKQYESKFKCLEDQILERAAEIRLINGHTGTRSATRRK